MFLIEAKGLGTDPEDNAAHSNARQERKFGRFKLRNPVHVEFRSATWSPSSRLSAEM